MIQEINEALEIYNRTWEELRAGRQDQAYFKALKPTAVGWKVADMSELDVCYQQLRVDCDQIHTAWLNERWLITVHLKDKQLHGGITVIKLMQRRPGATDKLGLDHVDFIHQRDAEQVLRKETDLQWDRESNNKFCSWLSIWFANTEAKLRTNTVIDVCIEELQETNKKVQGA
jgi:hypothetical protein